MYDWRLAIGGLGVSGKRKQVTGKMKEKEGACTAVHAEVVVVGVGFEYMARVYGNGNGYHNGYVFLGCLGYPPLFFSGREGTEGTPRNPK